MMSASEETSASDLQGERALQAFILQAGDWLERDDLERRISPDGDAYFVVADWLWGLRMFCVEFDGKQFFPPFAFNARWKPLPATRAILDVLWDYSDWHIAGWFESPNSYLDGTRPRELIARDRDSVERAARKYLVGALHA
jgi:hypothetical protein